MSNSEIIEWLKKKAETVTMPGARKMYQAAVKALEAQKYMVSQKTANVAICNACGKIDCDKMDKCEKLQLPPANCSEFPNNSDTISRQAAIDAVDSETVSTNPEHFKSSEKFIKFMDDADISSFGIWQWSNGFNTALVATTIQLKKLPSAQPEQTEMIKEIRKWINSANRGNADYFIVDKIEEIINRYE